MLPINLVHSGASTESTAMRKQECKLSDSTGTARLVLWEDHIGQVTEQHTYTFKDATVRVFEDNKYISLGSSAVIQETADIGDVLEEDPAPTGDVYFTADIAAVLSRKSTSRA